MRRLVLESDVGWRGPPDDPAPEQTRVELVAMYEILNRSTGKGVQRALLEPQLMS